MTTTARTGRNGGRWLLTLANAITVGASVAADWNGSHVFNKRWPAHARFHAVASLATTASLAALAVVAVWTEAEPAPDRRVAGRDLAAAVPVAYWGAFFPALLVPGTAVDDPPHPVARVAGLPTNLLGAGATTLTAVGGWLLDRRLRG
ncbi:DUF6640 family protein [Kitasatospora sp. LaBMicrA B282]|uniref:DUF6640 family protein n=1 Tax=Kitasatospora sp. LaBMicrA B282 TaxID=3420949 RepID=UPI003D0F2270